jgi:hypothetical protein
MYSDEETSNFDLEDLAKKYKLPYIKLTRIDRKHLKLK